LRSVCDIFQKLIFSDNSYNPEANFSDTIPDFKRIRNEVLIKLFKKLNLTMNIEAINNIVNVCIEILENRSTLDYIVSEEIILNHIFENLSVNLNLQENSHLSSYNYKEILILLLNVLKNSIIDNIKIPYMKKKEEANNQLTVNTEELENTVIGKMIVENLSKILLNFEIIENTNMQLDTTFGVSTRTIGIIR